MLLTSGLLGAPGIACRHGRLGDAAGHGRRALVLARQRGLLLQLLLFRGKGRRDVSTPLIFEIDRILLVDLLLLFRRRIGASDIEASILHEIEIGIAAAWLAAAGEFGVAFGKRGFFCLPALCLFAHVVGMP